MPILADLIEWGFFMKKILDCAIADLSKNKTKGTLVHERE